MSHSIKIARLPTSNQTRQTTKSTTEPTVVNTTTGNNRRRPPSITPQMQFNKNDEIIPQEIIEDTSKQPDPSTIPANTETPQQVTMTKRQI